MKVVLIEYNAGNYKSVTSALHRLGIKPIISSDAEVIRSADKVIFPGVGEASSTMRFLIQHGLDKVIRSLTQPVLGICLGMQLLCEWSEENDTKCLDIFPAKVYRFREVAKVPHMGWNKLSNTKGGLFLNLPEEAYAYFVHSFYVQVNDHTCATAHYGSDFTAAMQRDNFWAVQFHPEKSGDEGQTIINNFLTL
jgi:imidazole glycerol-phosphate synthase subunit HisH